MKITSTIKSVQTFSIFYMLSKLKPANFQRLFEIKIIEKNCAAKKKCNAYELHLWWMFSALPLVFCFYCPTAMLQKLPPN